MDIYKPLRNIVIPAVATAVCLGGKALANDFYLDGSLSPAKIGSYDESTNYPDPINAGQTNKIADKASETSFRGNLETGLKLADPKLKLGLFVTGETDSVSAKRSFEGQDLGVMTASSLDYLVAAMVGTDFDIKSLRNSAGLGIGLNSFGRDVSGPYGDINIKNNADASGLGVVAKYSAKLKDVGLDVVYLFGNGTGKSSSDVSIPSLAMTLPTTKEDFKRRLGRLSLDLEILNHLHILYEMANSSETTGTSVLNINSSDLGGMVTLMPIKGLNLGIGYIRRSGSTSSSDTSSNFSGNYFLFSLVYQKVKEEQTPQSEK